MREFDLLRPWTSVFLRELLRVASAHGVPESVRMNARDYADIRMFGRDELDLNVDQSLLKAGLVATFDGILLFADRSVPVGTMRVLGKDGEDLIHSVSSSVDVSRPAVFHPGPLSSCPDGLCVVQHVMNT